jgi:hypothetical protein
MRLARIAAIALLGILLISGLSCSLFGGGVKGTIQLASGLQGVLSVENIKLTTLDFGLDKSLLINGIIWNEGTQTVWFKYTVDFYDSSNRLLYECVPSEYTPFSLGPGSNTDLSSCFGCPHGDQVASYKIVFTQEPPPNW